MTRGATVRAVIAAMLLLVCAERPSAQARPAAAWAITQATMIDGTGAAPIADAVVAGRGERIVCAGRAGECQIPAGARVIEAAGKWIIPGLFDTHVHLDWAGDGKSEKAQLTRLAFGITTVREAGTPHSFERNLSRRQAAGSPAAPEPRLVVSGLVSQEHKDLYGEQEVGALVRRLAARGANAIKSKVEFSPGELRAIVTAAHAAGLPVFGHTWDRNGSWLWPALDAGIDGLSHMMTFSEYGQRTDGQRPPAPEGLALWVWTKEQWNYQDESRLAAAIARVLDQRVWVEPMLVTEKHFTLPYPVPDDVGYLGEILSIEQLRASLPLGDTLWPTRAARRARIAVAFDRLCGVVKEIHARGGVVLAGTDNMLPGPDLLDEIALLTGCGFTPLAALQAATRDAAVALNLPDAGTIAAGKLADLVILDADPLADPAHLRRTWKVIKGGHEHDSATLLAPARAAYRTRWWWAWTGILATALAAVAIFTVLLRGYRRLRRTRRTAIARSRQGPP